MDHPVRGSLISVMHLAARQTGNVAEVDATSTSGYKRLHRRPYELTVRLQYACMTDIETKTKKNIVYTITWQRIR